jgi:phosphoglycerol transferase MdoB-like AlkP superfamily enzyme
MNLFFSCVLALVAYYFYPEGIFDTPLSQLTLGKLLKCLLAGACLVGALRSFGQSLDKDRIWPWRWTWLYVGSLLFRCFSIACVCMLFYYLVLENKKMAGGWIILWAVAAAAMVLFSMFSSEYDLEKEKRSKELQAAAALAAMKRDLGGDS